jgi:hypothetical protein
VENRRNIAELLYTLFLIGLIALSWAFSSTDGFLTKDSDTQHPRYTSELLSSGSNDNLCVAVGVVLFALPMVIRVIAIVMKKRVGTIELGVFVVFWLFNCY